MTKIITKTVYKGTNDEFTGNLKEIAEHFKVNYNTLKSRLNQGYSIEEAIDWKGGKYTQTAYKGTSNEFTGSLNEIANHFNVNYTTLKSRLNKGYSIEEAIDWKGGKRSIIQTAFKGTDREFTGSLRKIANHFNINYNNFLGRLKAGYTIEEAIDWKYNQKTVFKDTDKEFTGGLKEIAKHYNINYCTFLNRLKYGYTLEEAIDWKGGKNTQTAYKGTSNEFTGSLNEIANRFNVNYRTFQYYLKRGYTIEKAINACSNTKRIKTVYKGTDKEFNGNLKEIAEHFNVNYNTLKKRLERNLSIEEAIELNNQNFNIQTVFKYTNKEFTGNLKEIAEHYSIDYNSFLKRLKDGYTIEEAIEIPKQKVKQNNLIYKGQKGNMKELCKKFNKNYIEVYNKVKSNHTFEYAMDYINEPYEE